MGFSVNSPGNFNKTRDWFKQVLGKDIYSDLDSLARVGVDALSQATPVDTGLAQSSWYYDIQEDSTRITINWRNDNIEDGASVVLLVQYGHGTRGGGYVAGRDFINPAIQPVMDMIEENVWEKVVNR